MSAVENHQSELRLFAERMQRMSGRREKYKASFPSVSEMTLE
jgi:hypothetical protein